MRTLTGRFAERLRFGVPLKDYTTLAIGGPAAAFFPVRSSEELTEAIACAREDNVRFLLIGGGSNLLVADEGTDCLVIRNEIEGIALNGDVLTVKSGTELQRLVDFTIEHGLAGMQRMTGIPGSVGGAVYGNAGAYGQTISDHLIEVDCFDGERIVTVSKEQCRFAYRYSAFKETRYPIVEARFRLPAGEPVLLAAEAKSVLAQRLVKYPVGLRCPGSFFMNVLASDLHPDTLALIPPDKFIYGKVPAGYLLEQVGAKGERRGDIEVAQASANLFVNRGQGTARDLHALAAELAGRVKARYGIVLRPEAQFVNLPPLDF